MKIHVAEAFRQVGNRSEPPEIQVSFYPFAGLNHTIRIRKQRVYVRVSDVLRDAPQQVYRALAFMLVSKLYNKRASTEDVKLYRQYAYQPDVLRASDLARQQRGRKRLTGSDGFTYNLDKLFARLNRQYFDNELTKPTLSWSARRTKRILGHHDYVHETIVISRSLDDPQIPEYLISFVMYHEMLHMKHRSRIINGRRIYHTAAFRADERRFDRYEDAAEELDKLAGR
ncbi:MAG: M48 family peptidase [Acidobacteria bacterium]|nr:M48 family peptidase [Acidobacteriota bacterium]MBK9707324.1 M48 family peptidase [Acidobacteriota bacterium]